MVQLMVVKDAYKLMVQGWLRMVIRHEMLGFRIIPHLSRVSRLN